MSMIGLFFRFPGASLLDKEQLLLNTWGGDVFEIDRYMVLTTVKDSKVRLRWVDIDADDADEPPPNAVPGGYESSAESISQSISKSIYCIGRRVVSPIRSNKAPSPKAP